DVLVLGAPGQDLVADDQKAGRNDDLRGGFVHGGRTKANAGWIATVGHGFTLPLVGRVDRRRRAGWGSEFVAHAAHHTATPTPARKSAPTLPTRGRVSAATPARCMVRCCSR